LQAAPPIQPTAEGEPLHSLTGPHEDINSENRSGIKASLVAGSHESQPARPLAIAKY